MQWTTWRDPKAGPPGERASWRERWRSLHDIWPVAVLFVFVIGGIYGGLFTATEGAGMGAFGAMAFALWRRALDWKSLYSCLVEAGRTTVMLFITGQLTCSLVLDHFGWLGAPVHPVDLPRLLGVACLMAGVVLIRWS